MDSLRSMILLRLGETELARVSASYSSYILASHD